MPERSEVTAPDGVRLDVETSGPADADVTVVLLHGWCLDRRTWHHQVAALPTALGATTARIVAYDARGHGRSSSTGLRSATLARLGDDLAAVIRQTGITGPVVLAGHSLGGMAIMEYAHHYPEEFAERVAGIVLVATTAEGHTHTRYGLPTPLTSLLRTAEQLSAGVLARCGAWYPHRAVLPALQPGVRWLLFGDACNEADLRVTMSGVARASLRSIGGFRSSVGAQQRLDTLAGLGNLPAAVIVGDRDRLTPPPCAQSIADTLPAAELIVLPGTGHMPMLERPDDVTTGVAAVVARALGRGATRRRPPATPPREGYEQAA
jgi:pimeloyl-ACP methyl ester carboxylesterase